MNEPRYRAIKDLKKLPNNPRMIKKEDFEKLKQSINDNPDYFEARPLVLSDRTGELVILAGNQRYDAALELGLDKAPTFLISGLSQKREKEIIIRDNVNNGEWDFDILVNEWDVDELNRCGVTNIKKSIQDEKELKKEKPSISTTFITFEYTDEIIVEINNDTATKLMAAMVEYKTENNSYDGFWDERLK
jgi:hypothetical protein